MSRSGILKPCLFVLALTCLSIPVGRAADRERVLAKVEGQQVRVQLQDLQGSAEYQLGIFDLGQEKLVRMVPIGNKEKKSTLNLSIDLPGAGLHQIKLRKNDEWISLEELPMVTVPTEGFRLLGGEIDRRSKKIDFRLVTSCIFRVVATNESQMHISTLQNWKFGSAGQVVSVAWDFWDREKVRNYLTDPSLVVAADYIPLPEGYIVTGTPDYSTYQGISLLRQLKLPTYEFDFEVSLKPNDAGKDKKTGLRDGLPVMVKGDLIRVTVSNASLGLLNGRRYEVLYFLEGDFMHEETEGISPSNYCLPDIQRPSGRHHLTVNIRDFNGNSGSSTVAFWHEEPQEQAISNP